MADKDSSRNASVWDAVAEQVAKLRASSGTGSTIGAPSEFGSTIGAPSEFGSTIGAPSESRSTIGAPSESGSTIGAPSVRSSFTGSTISVPASGQQWLVTNYLNVTCRASGFIRTYRVDFNPEEDDTRIKKLILKPHEDTLGRFVMDGHTLFIGKKIEDEHLNLETKLASGKEYQVTLRLTGELEPSNVSTNQFFNVAFRSVLQAMQFEAIGRSHFQREKKIALHEHKLELWPGVMTAISDRQGGKMLCIEATHKVLRLETALDLIQTLARRSVEDVKEGLEHAIVMTHYNRKTYRVDRVCFDISPRSVFKKDEAGNEVTYLDYYEQKYGIKIPEKEKDQPMLETIPRRKDVNKLADASPIYLVPSLCYMTGLTDSQRKNFKLMKALSEFLHLSPQQRKDKMRDFIKTLQSDKVMEILNNWNISIGTQFKKVPSTVLNPSMVKMKLTNGEIFEYKPVNADWTKLFSRDPKAGDRQVIEPTELKTWAMYYPSNLHRKQVEDLVKMLRDEGNRLGVRITKDPIIKFYGAGTQPREMKQYLEHQFVSEMGKVDGLQLVFFILPNNQLPRYAGVKTACSIQLQCASQCFQSKHMDKPSSVLKSVVQKTLIQLNAKLGGVPWAIKIPMKTLMVLGFDVYHCPDPRRKGYTVGALVGSINKECTKYHSVTSFHKDTEELGRNLRAGVTECLDAYRKNNDGALPKHLVLFRDGVCEGQLDFVSTNEVQVARDMLDKYYKNATGGTAEFQLSYIIVTKKINTRFVKEANNQWNNPGPGTLVDQVITLPGRDEFFLVSQTVRQGTVSPTNYIIINADDEKAMAKAKMEQLTYMMCHLYYNWSGTVAVPAPCQYAHKLSFLTGMATAEIVTGDLRDTLWYL